MNLPVSRRDFLKGGALLAASAASGGLTEYTDAPAEAQQPGGANERINIAVIGVHGRGMSHISAFSDRLNCRVTHVCDVDSAVVNNAMNTVNTRQGAPPTYVQDLRRLMDNRDIHAITIATPNHWHCLAAIWALQAGKHVYVEKPLSHNIFEGRRCFEVARAANKMCQVGMQTRSSPAVREAIKYIHDGHLGQVKLARFVLQAAGQHRSCPGDDTDHGRLQSLVRPRAESAAQPPQSSLRLALAVGLRQRRHRQSGPAPDGYLPLGANKNELPKTVQSVGGRFSYVDDGETANTQVAWFDYGEQQILFEVRGLRTARMRGVEIGAIIYGTNGFMVVTQPSTALVFDLDGNQVRRFNAPETHFANWIGAIRSGRREDLNADVLEGHLTAALSHLANISYRLGRPQPFEPRQNIFGNSAEAQNTMVLMEEHLADNRVALDTTSMMVGRRLTVHPTNENFPGDEEANRMLTRPYREGFVVPART